VDIAKRRHIDSEVGKEEDACQETAEERERRMAQDEGGEGSRQGREEGREEGGERQWRSSYQWKVESCRTCRWGPDIHWYAM